MTTPHHGQRNAPRPDLTTRSLSVRAASADVAARSIDVILATDHPVRVFDWNVGPIDEVLRLDGVALPDQVPLLADHNRFSIDALRGSIRDLRVAGDQLLGRAIFGTDADSERAWQLARAGHLTDLSVGYTVHEYTDIAPRQSAVIAGRTYTAGDVPLRITTRWSAKEGSLVPIGADEAAKMRAARAAAATPGVGAHAYPYLITTTTTTPLASAPAPTRGHQPQETSPMTFEQWLKSRGFDAAALNDAQRTALRADFDAEQVRAAPRAPVAPTTPAAVPSFTAEQIRILAGSARAFGVPLDDFCDAQKYPTVEAAIAGMNQARAATLAATTPAPAAPAVRVIAADADKRRAAVEDALAARMGLPTQGNGGMRSESLVDIARHAGLASGDANARDWSADQARAYALRTGDFRARAYTSSDFPNVLGNVARKALIIGFDTAPGTWRQWCGRSRVTDYKKITSTGIVAGTFGEQEAEGAPLGNLNLTESSFTRQAKMRGAHVVISEQTLVNDDLGEIAKTLRRLGATADATVELAVVKALLGMTWTTAITTGADLAGATPEAALAKAVGDFMNKTNPASLIIGAAPRFLLVPANLMVPAQKQTVAVTGNAELKVFAGKITPIVIPQLASAAIHANASADNFYLAGDPTLTDTLIVSDMYDAPVLKETDTGAVPGIGLRVEFPFGVDSAGLFGLQKATKA